LPQYRFPHYPDEETFSRIGHTRLNQGTKFMLKTLPGGWADAKATLAAIERSFAIIEFDP
jgi:hypothetical protein